jgi:hypothetical protein
MLSSWHRYNLKGCEALTLDFVDGKHRSCIVYISVEITAPFFSYLRTRHFLRAIQTSSFDKKSYSLGSDSCITMHAKSGVDGLYRLCPRCLILTSAND